MAKMNEIYLVYYVDYDNEKHIPVMAFELEARAKDLCKYKLEGSDFYYEKIKFISYHDLNIKIKEK